MDYIDPKTIYEVWKKAQEAMKRNEDETLENLIMLIEALANLSFLRLKTILESMPEDAKSDIPLESKVFYVVDGTLHWIIRELRKPSPLRLEIFSQTLKKALNEFKK